MRSNFHLCDTPFKFPDDVDEILNELVVAQSVFSKRDKQLGSIYYKNIPASFDTETTSMYDENGDKVALMYIWMFSINGKVIYGRTWDQFTDLMELISDYTNLKDRLIVYVHNLGFDFDFFRQRLNWHQTFSMKVREPLYAVTTTGIEFRDSYILTGKSLENSAKDLVTYKVNKKVGDLDYNLLRGSETPLTDTELGYCIYDCLVLDAIIQEKIEQEGNIAKIPLTSTGYVRRYVRNKCYPGSHHEGTNEADRYRNLMSKLTITDEEYIVYKRAFAGGFTHGNAIYIGEHITGRIDSFDFTSSYPAVILSEMFPMSRPTHISNITRDKFIEVLKTKLSIFDIRFNGIHKKHNMYESYISKSKCSGENIVEDNGRVVSADWISTTITNVDFSIMQRFYDWDSIQVGEVLVFEPGYLPKPIIESVLEFYKGKTELKGVEGAEVDYQVKKGMLNSIYGCIVTDIVRAMVDYNDEGWGYSDIDIQGSMKQYNSSKNRFLYYPWGIFVTAFARRNLFMGIQEFGEDYIYSDTDSIKCINHQNHMRFIEWYNEMITKKIAKCLSYHNISASEACPKNKAGSPKQIGVWDWETKDSYYTDFKTLGAKRYIYTQDGELHITIAGLGKKIGGKYISKQTDPYEFFNDDMSIPAEHTGKLLHSYINDPKSGSFIDYLGNTCHYSELNGVHLEPTPFSLSLTDEFIDYLHGIRVDVKM